jgi:DNA recombination protein RmuC
MTFPFFLILCLIVIGGFIIVIYFITQQRRLDPQLHSFLQMFQTGTASDQKVLHERLDRTTQALSDLHIRLGELSEMGRGMKDFQDFMKSPKTRGNIGEHILRDLLKQFLPNESFSLQYRFSTGDIVDAAITTSAGIIPIDSKFPMENFRAMTTAETASAKATFARSFHRDIKGHIDAISKKYILPSEGTLDYALMYIPSESVYYEVVNDDVLFDYASKHRILPVSPTTFYAYLKAILLSLEGQKIEQKAREVLLRIRGIQGDFEKVQNELSVLHKHLSHATHSMTHLSSRMDTLGNSIQSTQTLRASQPLEIDKYD